MNIQLGPNQEKYIGGRVGGFQDGAHATDAKKIHFVTPKADGYGKDEIDALGVPALSDFKARLYAKHVTLQASESADFARKFEWVGTNVIPDSGSPHIARVSRLVPGHFPVQIKRKADNTTVATFHVWVVWAELRPEKRGMIIEPFQIGDQQFENGPGFLISGRVHFIYDIQPAAIINKAIGPYLDGPATNRARPSGKDFRGQSLADGVEFKWDVSRIVRQKIIKSRSNLELDKVHRSDHAGMDVDHPDWPSIKGMTIEDWLVHGNDDATLDGEHNNPYVRHMPDRDHVYDHIGIGPLISRDTINAALLHRTGRNGDSVEWRKQFREFVRLEIAGKWYLISDLQGWRFHAAMKKVGGRWQLVSRDLDNSDSGW